MANYKGPQSSGLMAGYRQPAPGAPTKGMTSRAKPDAILASLPGEVLEVILEMLKGLHLGGRSDSCATCWMRDLCSLSLCSSNLSRAARRSLYEDVRLDGPDSAARKKRPKTTHRMELLRRTLRASPDLASLVRSLKVPQPDVFVGASGSKAAPSMDKYEESVAALVMACPNLERLLGPVLSYDGPLKGLLHALATRSNLRDMQWLIESSREPAQQTCKGEAHGEDMTPARRRQDQDVPFVEQHRNWTRLCSLAIHCVPGAMLTPDNLLTTTLAALPALQHLHLSGLPANVFNDVTLLSLPRLRTLSLTNLPGISSNGLSSFATRPNSTSLRKLHLRHTPLTSLPTVARILAHLASLVTFSLVQSFAPLMPETDSFVLCMMPYLASASVTKLHWAITSPADGANAADRILARSIEAGGFPALRTLRAPNDPSGVFQALCRPVERADLPNDRFRGLAMSRASPDSAPTSPTRHFLAKSPTASSLPTMTSTAPPTCTNLLMARLAAQSRIENARDAHRFRVQVEDEDGRVVEAFGMGGYVGTVGSNIDYCLVPDAGSADDKGGLVDMADVLAEDGEGAAGARDGCDGSWNWRGGAAGDRRNRERWWHTKRGRWTRVSLD
ncbi:hypothetical protein HRG_002618 [Hirsutella rhossiliensis]|uniref:Uncharacterized protein n=1 Tax=Hirsutella rhossiliensis TaxID=111463 RepID=A0A9P8N5M0_9HYPO|nr:uncharacterized protein HRG_02618 [Hirsutella rhossiliensis]KAH0967209.1 hypothetical protein HRG_02618 [Hirsutella rhossiliensis]